MKELETGLPILKIFSKLLDSGMEEWKFEVFVTDRELDTYRTIWKTARGKDPSDEDIAKDIQTAFLIDKMKGHSDFEKVEGEPD